MAAVNGVVAFGDLSLNKVGTGYTLTASDTGLTGVTSTAFNIHRPAFQGAGFETPSVGTGPFECGPTGTPWTYAGTAGVAGNGIVFTAGNSDAPSGEPRRGQLHQTGAPAASRLRGTPFFMNISLPYQPRTRR